MNFYQIFSHELLNSNADIERKHLVLTLHTGYIHENVTHFKCKAYIDHLHQVHSHRKHPM